MKRNSVYAKTGWPFPPVVTAQGGAISALTYQQDIMESLHILFQTLPGERIAHPQYGCDLKQFMFRPINQSLISDMENTIRDAITLFEPRINLTVLDIIKHGIIPYRLDINIVYVLRTVSTRYNITIPFYTMEEST